ncbi:MAG TPA: hypothetical protein VGX68_18105 [Thermoanaerobaculia bacterium]|jgi:hypothetical protein|nr:hypothetical protein [Thermoanaerobaculia bacterium]
MTFRRLLDRLVPPVLCLLAAIAATWPLLPSIAGALPLGTEHEATVPLFNLWTLWWDGGRVPHGFVGLWNAPIFHPLDGTFTFSEPLLLQGVALSPLWWMGAPPAAIYNLAILGTLICNGLATRSLARALGAPRGAALLAALAGVTLPYTAKVLGVLPVLPLFGTIWALAALVRFGEEGGWRPAALAVLSFAAQFLAGEQMALLSLPFLLLAGLLALAEQRFRARSVATLAAMAILGAVVLSPIAGTVSSFHEKYKFTRSEEVVAALSARPQDFTTRPGSARLAFPPREDSYAGDTGGLFPGFLLLGLGAAGAWLGWRQGERRLWIVCLLACAAGGGLLALGLNLRIGNWQPFASLREVVPGLRTLRSPFRAVAISQAVLAALAGLTLARLASWRGNAGRILALALGLMAATENLASSGVLVPIPATPRTAWTSWLRKQPGKLIVAHVPLPRGLHVSDYEIETWRMFAQIDHHRPLLNGYSGYFPSGYGTFQMDMDQNFPSDRLLCMMALGMGVNTLVLDRPYLEERRALFESDFLRGFFGPGYSDPEVVIVRLSPPPEACGAPH